MTVPPVAMSLNGPSFLHDMWSLLSETPVSLREFGKSCNMLQNDTSPRCSLQYTSNSQTVNHSTKNYTSIVHNTTNHNTNHSELTIPYNSLHNRNTYDATSAPHHMCDIWHFSTSHGSPEKAGTAGRSTTLVGVRVEKHGQLRGGCLI